MVSVAVSGNTSWVYDHSLVSYALKQPERLRSPEDRHKCHAPFKCAPTVLLITRLRKDEYVAMKIFEENFGGGSR